MKAICRFVCIAAVLILTFGLVACGGGGGGGGIDTSTPAGTWFGMGWDEVNRFTSMTLVIDSEGNITERRTNGDVDAGITGVLTTVTDKFYDVSFTDPSTGIAMVDDSGMYVVYAGEFGHFYVLQRGGTDPVPTYVEADIQDSWSGNSYVYSVTAGGIAQMGPASAVVGTIGLDVPGQMPITYTDIEGSYDGNISDFTGLAWAYYGGTLFVHPAGNPNNPWWLECVMSDDKQFAGCVGEDADGSAAVWPDHHMFVGLSRD
jgi:hypothetical protein